MTEISEKFPGILLELFLAAGSTKIVGLSLVFRLELRSLFVNFHFAYWIYCHFFIRLVTYLSWPEVYNF